MKTRQKQLLKQLTENYIKTAQPIASGFLVERLKNSVSSATIRNEMAELEKQGYIFQPHTSAGRIPTDKGYQFYIDNYLNTNKKMDLNDNNFEGRVRIKDFAKQIAKKSDLAVLLAFEKNDTYYTGLANLFSQPEFEDQARVVTISELIETFDQVLKTIYNNVHKIPEILIGNKGYFGAHCSFVVAKRENYLIGILGPLRMDYQKAYSLIKVVIKFLK